MARHAAQDKQVRQGVDDVGRVELAIDADRQALPGELNDVEHAELPAIVGPTLDEVIGPDMVGVLRSKPDTRSVIQPETSSLRLLLPSPDALDALGIHCPALGAQHRGDPAIAIAAIPGAAATAIFHFKVEMLMSSLPPVPEAYFCDWRASFEL